MDVSLPGRFDVHYLPGRFATGQQTNWRSYSIADSWRNVQEGNDTSWCRNVQRCETSTWRIVQVAHRPGIANWQSSQTSMKMFDLALFTSIKNVMFLALLTNSRWRQMPRFQAAITVKVKEVDLYRRLYCSTSHSRRSGTDHTVLPANYTVRASTS